MKQQYYRELSNLKKVTPGNCSTGENRFGAPTKQQPKLRNNRKRTKGREKLTVVWNNNLKRNICIIEPLKRFNNI